LVPSPLFSSLGFVILALQVNGQVKQDGYTSEMMFKIPALIEHVSSIMSLEASLFIYFTCVCGISGA